MAVHRLLDHFTRSRAAAGTVLVLGMIAIPVLPRVRQTGPSTSSTDVRTAERETQLARIARWREIRREARARGHASPAPPADSLRRGTALSSGISHPGGQ